MCDRYDPEQGDATTLDELLCEYVDGTMDPAVQAVFEEVLRADRDLADEVHALCCTRAMLCRYGCRRPASAQLEQRFRRRLAGTLARETMREQTPVLTAACSHLTALAAMVSAAALTLTLGLCVAALEVDAESAPGPAAVSYETRPHAPTATPLRLDPAPDRLPLLPVSTMPRGSYDVAFLQRTGARVDAQP